LPEFLAYWAAGPRGKGYFLDCAKQTTNLASINSTQLKAFPVPVVPMEEQAAIVDALRLVEGRIAVERRYAQDLESCKSALMSVLLTGEVRVTPDEEAA
jgi:type I restriction enzyme S subunit